jgi:hypothetical protein
MRAEGHGLSLFENTITTFAHKTVENRGELRVRWIKTDSSRVQVRHYPHLYYKSENGSNRLLPKRRKRLTIIDVVAMTKMSTIL